MAVDRKHPHGTNGREIRLSQEEGDDWWVAVDEETGVTSQGPSREAALKNLDEALEGYHGAGDAPTDDELREMGIDPEENQSEPLESTPVFE